MVTDKIRQLADYQEKVAILQKSIAKERTKALAHLHKKYGYVSAGELIKAIQAAAGSAPKRRGRKPGQRRKRAVITSAMRDKIKVAIQAGRAGPRIAKEFGISLPSVYNIKKAFGLVKTRRNK